MKNFYDETKYLLEHTKTYRKQFNGTSEFVKFLDNTIIKLEKEVIQIEQEQQEWADETELSEEQIDQMIFDLEQEAKRNENTQSVS